MGSTSCVIINTRVAVVHEQRRQTLSTCMIETNLTTLSTTSL